MKRGLTRRLASEDGAIAIIFAFMLVILLGATALVVDLGRQRHARQQLQDAVDSASIAAADFLPASTTADATRIKAMAEKIATGSATGLAPGAVTTTFWCVLRTPPNSRLGSKPDLGTGLGFACGPATSTGWDAVPWVEKGSRISHPCDPTVGDKCNAVKVTTSQTVKYLFAPAIGVTSGSTGAVQSVACQGACKPTGSPLDVALVLDRTGSMSDSDVANVKNAAKELLKVYDPAEVSVALLALPYANPTDRCLVQSPQEYFPGTSPDYGKWGIVPVPVPSTSPLSTDYKLGSGALNPASDLVQKIGCLARAGSPTIRVNGRISPSQAHTDLGDPMAAAADVLIQRGRATVPDVIIFMTDGQANQPWDPSQFPPIQEPCGYANLKAATAKNQGVVGRGKAEVFTVGYGIEDVRCPDASGDYSSGGPRGNVASGSLADMATNSTDDSRSTPGGCGPNENTDGDHYFCEDRGSSLAAVFRQIAIASLKNARLIDVD